MNHAERARSRERSGLLDTGVTVLERLARFSYSRRRLVVVLWIVALAGLTLLAGSLGGKPKSDFRMPDTESQRAFDLLRQRFPARSGDTGTIVFRADAGVNDPAVRARMETMFAAVSHGPKVVGVISPYTPEGARQIARDGKIAF